MVLKVDTLKELIANIFSKLTKQRVGITNSNIILLAAIKSFKRYLLLASKTKISEENSCSSLNSIIIVEMIV